MEKVIIYKISTSVIPFWYPHGNCVYISYSEIVQDVYNWCIQNVYKMYTKCIHFDKLWYSFLCTRLKQLYQLNFVYKMYTNVCQNIEYILYRFCIHQFWSTKSVQHLHYVCNLYTTIIQNECTNICMLNGSLISTYLDPFVVEFLAG